MTLKSGGGLPGFARAQTGPFAANLLCIRRWGAACAFQ